MRVLIFTLDMLLATALIYCVRYEIQSGDTVAMRRYYNYVCDVFNIR